VDQCYSLNWDVQYQGINVADQASGAGGDITVSSGGTTLLAIEVTERPIAKARVVSTFNTKIVRKGIADYLFLYSTEEPDDSAKAAAEKYFAQGHEINFLKIADWIFNNLGTMGSKCRGNFGVNILALLDSRDVPASVKVAWNDLVQEIVGG
jgi:hypothetical protein